MAHLIHTLGSKQLQETPFTPSQIPGLQVWLDGKDPLGSGIVPNSETVLATWSDKSGNGYNATGVNNPTFNLTGGVNFNSSYYTTKYTARPSTESVFIVYKTNSLSIASLLDSTAPGGRQLANDTQGPSLVNNSIVLSGSYTITTGTTYIAECTYSSSGINIYVTGNSSASNTTNPAFTAGNTTIGGSLNGTIYEVLIFNTVLSENERQVVEGYLAWKWGINTDLPSAHPFYTLPPNKLSLTPTFSPTQVPGLQMWLDGADPLGTGTAPANSTVIGTWYDKSGQGYNGTGVGNPTFNGGISFNGSYYTTTYTAAPAKETAFVVAKFNNVTNQLVTIGNSGVTSSRAQVLNNNRMQITVYNVGGYALGTRTVSAGTTVMWDYTYDSTISTYYNGNADTVATVSYSGAGTTNIGYSSPYFMNGTIYEILIFNTVLTVPQRQAIEGYLAWKWNLYFYLPTSHPYFLSSPNSSSLTNTFSPLQVPGLASWYDATDPYGTGQQPSTGTSIPVWTDKSGNARNLTQFSSYPVPTYSQNIINTLPTINFTNSSGLISPSFAKSSNVTILVIGNIQTTSSSSGTIWGHYTNRNNDIQLRRVNNSSSISWHTNNDNTNVNLTSTNSPALYSCTMTNGTGMFMQQTNTAGTTSVSFTETLTWTAGSAPVYVGISDVGETIQSYISEILYFQYVLSETQRKVLEGYLAWKWGIQANLPRTHPYYSSSPTQSSLPTNFLPTQVPGLQVWLDGADPLNTGIPPSSGTVIGTWSDKSGNGYDGTGVANSTFSTEGINFNQSYYTTAYTSFASTESIFVVYTTSTQSALVDTNSIGGRSFQSSTQGHSLISSGVGTRLLGAYAIASGTRYIAECTYSTAGINIYVTGTSSAANTTNPAFTAGTTLIGAGYSGTIGSFLNGTISEILIYNTVLTISQRQAIEGYLSWKWNTSLPNNHPFKYFTPAYNSLQTLTTYIYKPSYLPGLQAWYDANDPFGTGVRPANSVVMSNWYDKSGNSNTMEAAGSPTYTTGSQNGLPGITLSGNSGTAVNYYRTQIAPGTFMAELDAFVVYKNTSAATNNTLITRTLATGSSGNPLDFYGTSAFFGANSAYAATSSYNLYNTNTSIFNINISQPTAQLTKATGYTNGTAFTLTAGTWTPSDNGTLLNLGTRQDSVTGFNGLFYEVMVFNYPLSTSQRQFVEGYLAWKWGLYASLPTSHPYYAAAPNINTLFFQPTQIVGLNLWFDGADPLNNGTIPANGTAITTWSDKSGQGFNATGINTPTYSGGISLNGTQYYTTTYTSAPSSETAFVVVNFNNSTNQDLIGTINSLGGRQYKLFLGKMVINIYNTESYSSGTNSVPTGTTTLLNYTVGSGAITSFYNGNQENTITASAFSGTGNTSIGATYGTTVSPEALVNGILYEIIIFNRVLSTPQRQLVEGYLSWKWNMQSNLPTTHPYYTVQPSFLTLVPSYTSLSNISANAMTYLPLQANTIDVGLFPQTVTVNGTVSYSNVLGKACIYFNNSTANYLAFPMSNVYGMTIAFWFNTAGAAYYSAGGYSSSMRFDILNSTTATVYTALPNQWTNAPSATFGANAWNFIAVTINQNTFVENLYMNGSNASTATGTGPFLSPTTFIIGKSPDNTRAYQGFIQNFMYFNTVLTGAQISEIYEETSSDLAIPSPPTGLSLIYSNPTLTLTWNASLNATSYLVEFYGLASSGTTGGTLAQLYSNVTTTQVFSGKPPLNFYYATVTPVNSGVLGPIVVSSATPVLDAPLPPTNVIMGSFAASQTTISVNWTASLLASSYTVNFLSNASNSTSGGTVWQTITGVTGTSSTSSATLRSGIDGTYYYATVAAVNSGGSSSSTTSSGTIQYYIPKWISGNILWLDGNDTTNSLILSGNNVTQWKDKSGLSHHTTAVSTARPQRTTLNSRNAVLFSNSATVSNFLRGNLTTTYGTNGYTVVSVITLKNISVTSNVAFPRIFLVGLGSASTPGGGMLVRNGTRQQIALYTNNILGGNVNPTGTGTNILVTKVVPAYDIAFIFTQRITPTGTSNLGELAINGEAMTNSLYSGTSGANARSFSNYSIGNYLTTAAGLADSYNGVYGEILVYSSNITETHRRMAEGYLAWKWGLQASLAAGHPYLSASP